MDGWMMENKKIVKPASELVEKFARLRSAVSNAAHEFTGKPMGLSPHFHFPDLIGANEDMSRALSEADGSPAQISVAMDRGEIVYEVRW